MAATSYDFSISTDFPNHVVSSDRLTLEIQGSSIVTALDRIDTLGDTCSVWFKASLAGGDETTLGALVAAHSGIPLPNPIQPVVMSPLTSDGRVRIVAEKTTSSKITIFTHDWTDPTTWYTAAVRVVEEVAEDSGDHLTYELDHPNLIDVYHGLITGEDYLVDANGNSFRVVVKVNDVVKTEQDPHYGTGGDFTVNYVLGKVIFLSALAVNDVVKVTHHYATTSLFVVKPDPGKILSIDSAETQFSVDVDVRDTIVFQPYGYVDVFAPQYLQANGGPFAPGTLIPLGNPVKYKTMTDYQNDAERAYPVYPVMGGNSWRGASQSISIFDWDYKSVTPLSSLYGMEIRIFLEHETAFGGWYGTATFYCTSDPT